MSKSLGRSRFSGFGKARNEMIHLSKKTLAKRGIDMMSEENLSKDKSPGIPGVNSIPMELDGQLSGRKTWQADNA